MSTHGRGLICTPIEEKRADELQLNMMVSQNTDIHETAFTVSIDLIGQGCSTGISAYDRATGIKALIDPKTKAYRMRTERIVQREIQVTMPTAYGDFEVIAYRQSTTNDVHLVLRKGSWKTDEPVLVRVHSSSASGDILGILFDDHAGQVQRSLDLISQEGKGMLLVMCHGEKGQDLISRLKEYQSEKEPVLKKPNAMDQRDYGVGAQILRDQNISKLRLITNNPKRRVGLIGYGLEVVEVVGAS